MHITWIGSPNYYPLLGVRKRYIVLHWMVTNLAGCDATFSKRSSGVSAHYGIEDRKVHQYVKERNYAFANGTREANLRGISIEHSGGYMRNGSRVKPSKLTHETSAQLCADIARRHKLGRLKVGVNLFPHRHFTPTACPGSLDLAFIARRANELNAAR